MFYELVMLSIHNLLRVRVRLMMTAGGVMIGTTAIVLLIALTSGLQAAAEAGIGNSASLTQITVRSSFRRNDTGPTLNLESVSEVAGMDGVDSVVPVLSLDGSIDLRMNGLRGAAQVYGIYPASVTSLGVDAAKGTLALSTTDPYGAIVGATVPENFYDVDADTFTAVEVNMMVGDVEMRVYTQGSKYRTVSLHVNAVLESGSSQDSSIFLPLTTVIDLNERISGSQISLDDLVFDQFIIQATSRETAGQVLDDLDDLGYNASGMGSYLSQINEFFGTMKAMLTGVGAVALLVAAFGVANTMMMAILERTREIGLMKAVGATDRAILTIFLVEAGLVGLLGGTAGLTICYTIRYGVNRMIANMGNSTETISFMNTTISVANLGGNLIDISPQLAMAALGLATCIGIAAGVYPAIRAARMVTVLALKTE